ncbi:MAG TPA: GAF domain-containing protein, partial [Gemmatimonadaceae bacterium]
MTELPGVLGAFLDATGCPVTVWAKEDGGAPIRLAAAPGDTSRNGPPPLKSSAPYRVESPGGVILIAPVPGPRRAWIAVGPCANGTGPLDRYLKFLLPVVAQYLQSTLEVEHAANELAERYEEINLLYTITEILGRTVSLEEAAATILREVSETVGARRGSILVHDRVTDTLQAVAALGVPVLDVPPIAVSDECSVSARVFREERSMIVEDDEDQCDAEVLYRRGAMLSVPIMWTAPNGGSRPLGVVNLSDRRSGQPFTAGDQKLITAIATQIGTAIQNAR